MLKQYNKIIRSKKKYMYLLPVGEGRNGRVRSGWGQIR